MALRGSPPFHVASLEGLLLCQVSGRDQAGFKERCYVMSPAVKSLEMFLESRQSEGHYCPCGENVSV